MKNIRCNFRFFILITVTVLLSVSLFSACGDGKGGDKESGGLENNDVFEDKSDIFVVSEETFNSEIKNKSKTDFKFSPKEIFEKREKSLIEEKKYYVLFYIKDTVIKEAAIRFRTEPYYNAKDKDIYVGTNKGKVTGEATNSGLTITREGKAVNADLFVAVEFTNSKISDNMNSKSYNISFYSFSEYDYEVVMNNEIDFSLEKDIVVFRDKQIKASSSVKYLSENDYKGGRFEDKLKDTAENVAVGEKIYAVIDYKLSGAMLIEETDTLTFSLNTSGKDGVLWKLTVEEFPTADYKQNGNNVTATFKPYGAVAQEKLFRFIVSLEAESSGSIELDTFLLGAGISITEGESVSGTIVISTDAIAESYLEYTLSSDGTYYIITGIGNERRDTLKLPEKHNDLPVKEIGENVFSSLAYIKKVEIPSSITKIGNNAFRGCIGLESIVIPSSVNEMGDNAFADLPETGIYCFSETKPKGWSSNWTTSDSYVLWKYSPLIFTLIDSGYAFSQKDRGGVNIAIPREYNGKPITAIYSISPLAEKVKIPDTVKNISSNAFQYCQLLKEIVIPDSVEKIGQYAFSGCSSLTKVTFGENSKLRTILNSAFSGCRALTSFTVPKNLTSIGEYAFHECTSLTSFTVPENVTSIGEFAFKGDEKLVEIINKSSLTLTAGAETNGGIAKYAFKVHSGVSEIVNKEGYLFYTHSGNNYLLGYVGNETELMLPSDHNGSSYEVYKYAFYSNKDITGLVMSNGVRDIGKYAFFGCSGLTYVNVSDNVESIGEYAFYYCNELRSVNVSENGNLKNIGANAFKECQWLSVISLPNRIINIASTAFSDTYYLNNRSNFENGCLYIGKHLIKIKPSHNQPFVTIKDGTLSIANGVKASENIVSVLIPESVKFIGSSAFSSCDKLVEVINKSDLDITENSYGLKALKVHSGESEIIDRAGFIFYTFDGVNYLLAYTGDKTDLVLPDNFNGESYEIYNSAFCKRANLTSVIIPNNVTAIGNNAFDYCSGLIEITVPDSVIRIGKYAFRSCEALTKVTVGTGVTSIGSDAFWTCPLLTGIYISDLSKWCVIDFEDSGSNPLLYAKNLYLNGVLVSEIYVPSGITHINNYAFYRCTSIRYVYIPTSVVSIGDYAFSGCDNIQGYVYQGTEEQWNEIAKGSYWYGSNIRNFTYNGSGNW